MTDVSNNSIVQVTRSSFPGLPRTAGVRGLRGRYARIWFSNLDQRWTVHLRKPFSGVGHFVDSFEEGVAAAVNLVVEGAPW